MWLKNTGLIIKKQTSSRSWKMNRFGQMGQRELEVSPKQPCLPTTLKSYKFYHLQYIRLELFQDTQTFVKSDPCEIRRLRSCHTDRHWKPQFSSFLFPPPVRPFVEILSQPGHHSRYRKTLIHYLKDFQDSIFLQWDFQTHNDNVGHWDWY